jgi:hypothetical protein
LADDQLQGRLVVNCLGVAELDDCYLEAAELDDHLVQCAVQLVQLVQLTRRIRPAQQVLLQVQQALSEQLVLQGASQPASQQGRRW